MKKKFALLAVLLIAMLCLTACPDSGGGSALNSDIESGVDSLSVNEKSFDESAANNDAEEDSLFTQGGEGQKLVYSGNVTIKTNNMDKTYEKIADNMKEYKAFFESVNESSTYKTMYIRVPKKDYMAFYESLSEVGGTVVSSNVNIEDRTKTYTDNERRIEILQTEYDELKELMEKANTVDEVLSIRQRMSNVTYELETLKGSNKTIDYDADYGRLTVELSLNGTHDEETFWHQLGEAFSGGIYLLKQIFLGLVYIWWIILLVVYLVIASKKKLFPFNKIKTKKEKQAAEVDKLFDEDNNETGK